VVAANRDKVAAIRAAPDRGVVSTRFPADELMILITGLSMLGSRELAMTGVTDVDLRRRALLEAVRLLTTRDEGSA
jgi:hypothetical protein